MNFEKYIKLLEKYNKDRDFIEKVKKSYKNVVSSYEKDFASRNGLMRIRKERGLSRKDIVDLLYEDKFILSETTIYNFEKGKSIENDSLERIAKVLDVSIEDIL